MKKSLPFLITGSLLLNVVLAFYMTRGSAANDTAAVASANGPAMATTAGATAAAAPKIDAATWTNLQTAELPALANRLREAGFPIEMIRAMLMAQITESFNARRKALDPDAETRPFWKNRPTDSRIEMAMQQTYREQQKLLRDVLGKDAEGDDPMSYASQGRRLDGLPPEQADQVKEILRNFNDQRQEIYAAGMFTMDREKLAALDKAQNDAISRALTPQQFDEYSLRNSNTGMQLRSELSAFNPTEEEFRALFKIRQPFDERYTMAAMSGPMSPELMRERSEAQRALPQQMKAALSPERAAEYDRATDFNYRQTSQLVARLEMAPTTTDQVYAVQKEIQAKVQPLYMNRDLTPEARNAQLVQLAQEAKTKITPILGDRGYEAYKQYGGSWMSQLTPRPATAGPAVRGGAGGGEVRIITRPGGE